MSDYSKNEKLLFYNERKVNSGKAWLLFMFLGWSYGSLGKIGKQIFYYLTIGGLGLWTLYVLFTLNGKIKGYNRNVAKEVGLDEEDITMLGLSESDPMIISYKALFIIGGMMLVLCLIFIPIFDIAFYMVLQLTSSYLVTTGVFYLLSACFLCLLCYICYQLLTDFVFKK